MIIQPLAYGTLGVLSGLDLNEGRDSDFMGPTSIQVDPESIVELQSTPPEVKEIKVGPRFQ
jgi:hypothetical protein